MNETDFDVGCLDVCPRPTFSYNDEFGRAQALNHYFATCGKTETLAIHRKLQGRTRRGDLIGRGHLVVSFLSCRDNHCNFKVNPSSCRRRRWCLINRTLFEASLPKEWCRASLTLIPKKGRTTDLTSYRALQADLDSISSYCTTWQLRMNAAKCSYTIFTLATGGADWRNSLTLNGQEIPYTAHTCLLGVTLDRKLLLRTLIRTVASSFDQRFYGLSKMGGSNWGSSAGVLRTL